MNIGISQSAKIDTVLSELARESKATTDAFERNARPEAEHHAQRVQLIVADLQRAFYASIRVDDPCTRGQCSGCDIYDNCPAVPSLLAKQEGLGATNQ